MDCGLLKQTVNQLCVDCLTVFANKKTSLTRSHNKGFRKGGEGVYAYQTDSNCNDVPELGLVFFFFFLI